MKDVNPHESYLATPNIKTDKDCSCRECHLDSIRKLDKKEVEKKKNSKTNSDKVKIGDETEEFVKSELIKTNIYKDVERLGNIGGNADIKITQNDDKIIFIQVKTISVYDKEKDIYILNNKKRYEDNMVMVLVNKDRDRFALFNFSEIKNIGTVSLRFNSENTIYKNNIFLNLEDFINRLIEMIPNSVTKNVFSKNNQLEFDMFERFTEYCVKNGLIFVRNQTNGNTVDGYINNYRLQLKFCSKNKKTNYFINSVKSSGILKGKYIKRNYEEGDFDFVIIEVGGTEDDDSIYKNNFCIIPSSVLIERGILKTEESNGKNMFNVCPPVDNGKKHWSREYWNNISLLK